MATRAAIRSRMRLELGDQPEPFQTVLEGDGETQTYDLPVGFVDLETLKLYTVVNSSLNFLAPSEYTYDPVSGTLLLSFILDADTNLYVEGQSWALFTDDELNIFINDAVLQHCHNEKLTTRYRDTDGFIKYKTIDKDLSNLPEIEEFLVALLATVQALWALATDASTDIDVSTAEGTHISRAQRYAQIRSQIDVLTAKYKEMAQQLNVGIFRIEMSTLRRRSRQTGRLVPIFEEREYDDYNLPRRELPPIDSNDVDDSGVPSPAYGGWW